MRLFHTLLSRRKLMIYGILGMASLGIARPSQAQDSLPNVSALRAYEKSQAGDWILLDVRSRGEWNDGIAQGARLISMHEPDFLSKLERLTQGNKDAEIALICATGGRTGWLQPQLKQRGYTRVYNVGEGMFGSRYGVGWIKRELPTTAPDASAEP